MTGALASQDLIVSYMQTTCLAPLTTDGTLKRVYYGDQSQIPDFPAAIVQAGVKRRDPNGATRQAHFELDIKVTVIHYKVGGTEEIEQVSLQRAETVEATLNGDLTMGGLVIFGSVTMVTPVLAARSKAMHRAHQLLWTGLERVIF